VADRAGEAEAGGHVGEVLLCVNAGILGRTSLLGQAGNPRASDSPDAIRLRSSQLNRPAFFGSALTVGFLTQDRYAVTSKIKSISRSTNPAYRDWKLNSRI
jgi:hypothetical protein